VNRSSLEPHNIKALFYLRAMQCCRDALSFWPVLMIWAFLVFRFYWIMQK